MRPVRIAAMAETAITIRPASPMTALAAKKEGTDSTPLSCGRADIYACQEAYPSGTAATLITASRA